MYLPIRTLRCYASAMDLLCIGEISPGTLPVQCLYIVVPETESGESPLYLIRERQVDF